MLIFTSVFTRYEINANQDAYGYQVLVKTPFFKFQIAHMCNSIFLFLHSHKIISDNK